MNLYEQLSALLDGDLDPEQAAALRERIAREPEVRAAWERMSALPLELAALPDPVVPPSLDAALLAPPARNRRLPIGWIAAAVAAVAAVALAVTRAPAPPVEIVVASGDQLVEGQVTVRAGDARVAVDGVARIRVEPDAGVARVPAQEDRMKQFLIGAGTGALVAVTVVEGSALVWPSASADAPIAVGAGETRMVMATPRRVAPDGGGAPAPAIDPSQMTIDQARARIAELEQRLAESEFAGALAKGQLAVIQGEPQTFPAGHPAAFGPEGFDQTMRAVLEGIDGVTLEAVDCAEYPCIAYVTRNGAGDRDWFKPVEEAVRGAAEGTWPEGAGMMAMVSETEGDDGGPRGVVGLAVMPPADGHDEGLQQRTGTRVRDHLEGI